jgi:hypothetical protein
MVGRMALGQIFFEFLFPLPILILPTAPRSCIVVVVVVVVVVIVIVIVIIIIRTGTIGPIVADIRRRLRKKKKKKGMPTVLFFRHGWNMEIPILRLIAHDYPLYEYVELHGYTSKYIGIDLTCQKAVRMDWHAKRAVFCTSKVSLVTRIRIN